MSNITLYLKPAQTWRHNDGGGVPTGCVGRQFNIFETKDGGPIIGYVVRTRGNAGQVCVYPKLYQLLCKLNPNWRNGITINRNRPVHGPNPTPWGETWCNVVPLKESEDFDPRCVCGDLKCTYSPKIQFAYSRLGVEWISQFFDLDFIHAKISKVQNSTTESSLSSINILPQKSNSHHVQTDTLTVDLLSQLIYKPAGKSTPNAVVSFRCLPCYLKIYLKEIDIQSAQKAVNRWNEGGRLPSDAVDLIRKVIVNFGGGYRIWGRYADYYEKNSLILNQQLEDVFKQTTPDSALEKALEIKGLGESYASKLLRFVSSNFVVVDTILRQELLGTMPYISFVKLCSEIGSIMSMTPVEVESALFTLIQLAKPQQRKKMWRQYQIKQGTSCSICRCSP